MSPPLAKTGAHLLALAWLPLASLLTTVSCARAQPLQAKPAPLERGGIAAAQEANRAFDTQYVFIQMGSAEALRQRLNSSLNSQIEWIERACEITLDQNNKLKLMGRGDIKRFFDRYDNLKARVERLDPDHGILEKLDREISLMSITSTVGLFHHDSLLHRSLPSTLTAEQFTLYVAAYRKRLEASHLAAIHELVTLLEEPAPLPTNRKLRLITFLTTEIEPAPKLGPYGSHYLIEQIGRLSEKRFRPLLDHKQWFFLEERREQIRHFIPLLREAGCFPNEEEREPSNSDVSAAALSK